MSSEEFVERLKQERGSAILRTSIADAAAPAMEAAVRGGFHVVEFTLNTPGAFELIEEFSRRADLVVGAGTVLTVDDAREAVRRGAQFLVSPVTDEEVIAEASRLGVASIPGTHSPTEMLRAHRAGAPLVKLFPAPSSGPKYVAACLGPMPFLKIVPTSGVTLENAATFLEAGAHAVGLVAPLFDAEVMRERRFDLIEERARGLRTALGF